MAKTIRCVVTGICAFVPCSEEVVVLLPADHSKDNRMAVGHDTELNLPLVSHEAVLQFPMRCYSAEESARKPDIVFAVDGELFGLIRLQGEVVEFTPTFRIGSVVRKVEDISGRPGFLTVGQDLDSTVAPRGYGVRDFRRVIDFQELAGDNFDASVVTWDKLSAAVILRGGVLSSGSVTTRQTQPVPHKAEALRPSESGERVSGWKDQNRYVAETVNWEVVHEASGLSVSLRPLGASESYDEPAVHLSLSSVPAGGSIEVMVKNMPLLDVMEARTEKDLLYRGLSDPRDLHFYMFYDMLGATDGPLYVPTLVQARIGWPWCPPALMRAASVSATTDGLVLDGFGEHGETESESLTESELL